MYRTLVAMSLVISACTGVADLPTAETTPAVTVPEDLSPGVVDLRSATMSDGTQIEYGLILPEGFDPNNEYPVLLALPPGGQSIDLAVSVAQATYLPEALAREWVIIAPAAPNGMLFFQGSERYIGELLDSLSWIRSEDVRYHLAGISNGGRSAFAVAQLDPDRYTSMVVFPGYPESPSSTTALANLTRLPISMFVGGSDPAWIEPMTVTRDTLHSMGGSVSLVILEGEGHIMTSLSDGVTVFDFLDSTR